MEIRSKRGSRVAAIFATRVAPAPCQPLASASRRISQNSAIFKFLGVFLAHPRGACRLVLCFLVSLSLLVDCDFRYCSDSTVCRFALPLTDIGVWRGGSVAPNPGVLASCLCRRYSQKGDVSYVEMPVVCASCLCQLSVSYVEMPLSRRPRAIAATQNDVPAEAVLR